MPVAARATPTVSSRLVSRKSASVPIEPVERDEVMFTPSTSRWSVGARGASSAGSASRMLDRGGELRRRRCASGRGRRAGRPRLLQLDPAVDVDVEPARAGRDVAEVVKPKTRIFVAGAAVDARRRRSGAPRCRGRRCRDRPCDRALGVLAGHSATAGGSVEKSTNSPPETVGPEAVEAGAERTARVVAREERVQLLETVEAVDLDRSSSSRERADDSCPTGRSPGRGTGSSRCGPGRTAPWWAFWPRKCESWGCAVVDEVRPRPERRSRSAPRRRRRRSRRVPGWRTVVRSSRSMSRPALIGRCRSSISVIAGEGVRPVDAAQAEEGVDTGVDDDARIAHAADAVAATNGRQRRTATRSTVSRRRVEPIEPLGA